ncbi:E3 ubiquitin-protein ligase NHLRC1-like [Dromiciops gliroides]|uniref:E3 ubiquitin-protein ligase NHLRC1-like n=1 Tax=Dromiciops gliroides TaxID=33562 RepID=UPI001CC6AC31|nr:E3 ubiquitin-protein ligase NHLRC1-like [Dromiciops gliroides]
MAVQSVNRSVSVGDLVREAEMSLLECKVCFEKYSHEQPRRPRNLGCGHVICLSCLVNLLDPQTQTIECPFCRSLTTPRSDCLLLLQVLEFLGPALSTTPPGLGFTGPRAIRWFPGALTCVQTFGGWGKLINPNSLAFCRKTGNMAVTHDGRSRVKIFGPDGVCAQRFGERGNGPENIRYALGVTITSDKYVVVTDAGDRSVKVFDFAGQNKLCIQGVFSLPWGVQTTPKNEILVADNETGSLYLLKIDFKKAELKSTTKLPISFCNPRSIAVCPFTGFIAVAENLKADGCKPASSRIRVFSPTTLKLLGQVDSFGLSLFLPAILDVTSISFDFHGNLLVADAANHSIGCLGKPWEFPSYKPVITHGLSYPAAMSYTDENTLIVLDSGTHTVKLYAFDWTL